MLLTQTSGFTVKKYRLQALVKLLKGQIKELELHAVTDCRNPLKGENKILSYGRFAVGFSFVAFNVTYFYKRTWLWLSGNSNLHSFVVE